MTTNNVKLPMIRKVVPSQIAQNIMGVQPLMMPSSQVFTARWRYDHQISILDVDGLFVRIRPPFSWMSYTSPSSAKMDVSTTAREKIASWNARVCDGFGIGFDTFVIEFETEEDLVTWKLTVNHDEE